MTRIARDRAATTDADRLAAANRTLAALDAAGRIRWALGEATATPLLTSSFGAQAAVMLHLVTRERPDIPVLFIDTGYLFAETYAFVETLTAQLGLNLIVYQPRRSAAWQEAREGQRWEQGLKGLEAYNRENKIEPMERALDDLDAGLWFSGVRRSQSTSRQNLPYVAASGQRLKVHPILDWTDRDVHRYLTANQLPYHPLWHRGYVSIGDVHSTKSLHEVDSVEATRFNGVKRECGLHEMDFGNEANRF
ncbi:MAG: phosphoadenylyl-sulfate reductase [Pseudomonadota bacterium]